MFDTLFLISSPSITFHYKAEKSRQDLNPNLAKECLVTVRMHSTGKQKEGIKQRGWCEKGLGLGRKAAESDVET